MAKEMQKVVWIIEAKLQGYVNAREYFEELIARSEGEKKEYAEEAYKEECLKERVIRDILDEIKEWRVEGWE